MFHLWQGLGRLTSGVRRFGRRGKPILVTGMPRSGTTWVGRTLGQSLAVGYIHEPFKPAEHAGTRCLAVGRWFQYICEENFQEFINGTRRVTTFRYNILPGFLEIQGPRSLWRFLACWAGHALHRMASSRALIKDPIALFSAEWLAAQFNMDVVVVLRHPAAFVSSVKALHWPHDFKCFAEQPLLMKHHLGPFEQEILAYAADPPEDIVARSILFWKCGYHLIMKYRDAHPEWLFVRHEDLAMSPLEGFRLVFEHLGLEFNERIANYVTEHTTAASPAALLSAGDIKRNSRSQIAKWKSMLTAEEIVRIRTELDPWWRPFYSDADW